MNATSAEQDLRVPPLGFPAGMVSVSVWLVGEGATVLAGDRVVQLVAGAATIDLLAPVSGRLARHLVDEDQMVEPGDLLAIFTPHTDAASGRS